MQVLSICFYVFPASFNTASRRRRRLRKREKYEKCKASNFVFLCKRLKFQFRDFESEKIVDDYNNREEKKMKTI